MAGPRRRDPAARPVRTAAPVRAAPTAFARYLRAVAARRADGDPAAATERVEALEDEIWTLRELAERYRSALDAAGDVVLRCDPDRRVVFANDGFETVFGLAPDAVTGESVDALLARFQVVAEEPDPPFARDRLMATVSGPRWFSLGEIPVAPRPADPAVLQVMLRDIGDRRAIEAELRAARDMAEAANAAKSRFLALASHEIRTPLNGILGMADLLAETPLSSEQLAYVRAVRTSGEALLSLVDDVLDLAKIEAGRLDVVPAPARLDAIVEGVVELLAPRAQAKGLELAAHVSADLPALLLVDAARFRQVLINLAGNAIKFTDRGGVAITIGCDGRRGDAVRLRVSVSDTGIGIAPDDVERIFREYEQAESGPARRYGGTGLGLAISRAIVRRMGGEIAVESRPGAGSTFRFDFEAGVDGTAREARAKPLAARRLLVLSPGLIDPVLLARRLTDLGAAVVTAADPAEARSRLGSAGFDAILIDHRADFDAGAALTRLGPERPPAGVILAPSDRSALDRLRADGFAGYLVKPVRSRSLAMVATALVERRPLASDATDGRVPERRPGPAARGGLSILIADDNAINALLARALVGSLGHRADCVTDGLAAIAAVETAIRDGRPFDAVLMDLHMPTLDGYGAIRAIRAAETAGGRRTAVIALTADTTAETEREALAAGADARLVKPIDAATLAAVLDQLVGAAGDADRSETG